MSKLTKEQAAGALFWIQIAIQVGQVVADYFAKRSNENDDVEVK